MFSWSCGKGDDSTSTENEDTGCGDTATDTDSDTDSDSDIDTDSDTDIDTDTDTSLPDNGFIHGPVTPPFAEGEGTAYIEGDCIHTYVAASCESGWCRIPNGCFIFGTDLPPDFLKKP